MCVHCGKKIVLLAAFLFQILLLQAVGVKTLPYYCGFEDEAENSEWVLNAGNTASYENKWYVSSFAPFVGEKSLLISADAGKTNNYVGKNIVVTATRDFILDKGSYELTFNWKANGNAGDGLYVCWLPASKETNSTVVDLPDFVKNYKITFTGSREKLSGSSMWKQETVKLDSRGAVMPMKLVFVWVSTISDNVNNSAANIDEVQLASYDCAKPRLIEFTSTAVGQATVNWVGGADSYDFAYKKSDSTALNYIYGLKTTSVDIDGLVNGTYDIFVKSNCNRDTSAWAQLTTQLLYYPDAGCVNYLDIHSPNVVCTTGDFYNPYMKEEVVDHGPANIESRHTIHMDPKEYDPRTGGKLKVVPDGHVASVRLGNWNNGKEAESITYTIDLDSSSQTLLTLNYALILEAPDHPEDILPKFTMDVLDAETGKKLDADCMSALFYGKTGYVGRDNWNLYSGVVWKDWTAVGVNLAPYAGRSVKVRLTMYDCGASAHYSYGYFILTCQTATIKGLTCGELADAKIEAPVGFNYEWYKEYDPKQEVVCRTQELITNDQDTSQYACKVIFIGDTTCYFTLHASLLPRFPVADYRVKHAPKDCVNGMRFTNASAVFTPNGRTTEQCSGYQMVLHTGDTIYNVDTLITYPNEGGEFPIMLIAEMSGGHCTDTLYDTISVPSIVVEEKVLKAQICGGNSFTFNGLKYNKTGRYTQTLKSSAGCDSLITLELLVEDKVDTTLFNDTICYGDTYKFNGQNFKVSGEYMSTYRSSRGCDSLVILRLKVQDEIDFSATSTPLQTGANSGSIQVVGADSAWGYTLNGIENASLENLAAGNYELQYFDSIGCTSDVKNIIVEAVCAKYNVGTIDDACGDDGQLVLPLELLDGSINDYSIVFSQAAKDAGFADLEDIPYSGGDILIPLPTNIRPNNYKLSLVLNDLNCSESSEDVDFAILYPATILEQKWNDVVATLSPAYNGGYSFSNYQWYRKGVKLPNETGPYLYLDDSEFSSYDSYSVMLTREDDGVSMMTCELETVVKLNFTDYPTRSSVETSGALTLDNVQGCGTAKWYDYLGRLISSSSYDAANAELMAPSIPGFYILELDSETGKRVIKIYVHK